MTSGSFIETLSSPVVCDIMVTGKPGIVGGAYIRVSTCKLN